MIEKVKMITERRGLQKKKNTAESLLEEAYFLIVYFDSLKKTFFFSFEEFFKNQEQEFEEYCFLIFCLSFFRHCERSSIRVMNIRLQKKREKEREGSI